MNILSRLYEIIRVSASPCFTMLEFGACDGYHTNQFVEMLRSHDRSFVLHAFEPVASNFTNCERSVKNRGAEVHLWPMAVGAAAGELPFYVSGGVKRTDGKAVDCYYGSSSLRPPKLVTQAWPDMTFTPTTVRTTTLDAFAAEHLVGQSIDFIWADVQGAQGDLVRGGAATWSRVHYLYVEYDNSEMYEGELTGVEPLRATLPGFEIVEDYGGDVLLENSMWWRAP